MSYDAQQYTFSHGLVATPQLHLQQQQFQQQQQQIFQQQYNQAIPASNVYQFQFAGGGSPVNHIFQQKDAHQMGVMGGVPSRMAQHGSIQQQSFMKQGMPVGIDIVSGLDGMIYSQQKNSLNIITNSDGRIMQQTDDAVRMQQALVGVDMMRSSNFIDQDMNAQQNQHQGITVAGRNNMFAYGKQHFSGWLQPQQISMPGTAQYVTGCQSTLPSFNHVWSQFQQPKQVDPLQQQHLNQFQRPQQFQNQLQQQQQQHQMQSQLQFTAPSYQTTPNIQRIKMHQQQKAQQMSAPVSVQSCHLQQEFNCFSPHSNHISPNCIEKEIPEWEESSLKRTIPISPQSSSWSSFVQPISSCIEHHPTTAVTYTISVPPKVTVTLDSLTHSEIFPPNQLPGRPEVSFKSHGMSAHFVKGKIAKTPSSIASSLLSENFPPQREWQTSQNQRNSCLPKPLVHSSSTGSSLERSSSESSNFSSPPYIVTPPSSSDSIYSPVLTHFPKTVTESTSSGRTSANSSSSSSSSRSLSSSPNAPPSKPLILYATSAVPTLTTASSMASSTCTMSAATVVSSCSSMAITTTSVMSTTPSPKESTSIASVRCSMPVNSISCCSSENRSQSCSPAHRLTTSTPNAGADRKVKVPYSWQRKFENGVIVYLSPSGVVLQSLDQICHYLLSDSTCKCGLECPIQLDKFFNFDPDVGSQPWSACSGGENLGNLCNHRREMLALVAFHSSQSEAALSSGDYSMWLGRKRERKKSVGAPEELIVAPLKKLKTSITKAVNKHALSLGTCPPQATLTVDSTADGKSLVLNTDTLFQNTDHLASVSPASSHGTPGVFSNPCDFSSHTNLTGRSDFQKTHNGGGEMPESVSMQKNGDPDGNKPDFYHIQQHHGQQGSGSAHTFMPIGDNHVFHSGSRRDLSMGMQSQYPLVVGPHNSQHSMQYPQGKLSHHHHHQLSTNPDLFYPQNQAYPNMTHIAQQHTQGFHPTIWQGSCPDVQATIPHSHHHPSRQYPSVVNFQHSNFNLPQPRTPNRQTLDNKVHMDCTKAKPKRSKSKKDKQKPINSIVDRSSPCSKVLATTEKAASKESSTASFFGNPIVFVEQQAAIINSSIASCHITFSSPSPPQCQSSKPVVTHPTHKNTTYDNKVHESNKDIKPVIIASVEVPNKNNSVNEEDEDQKTVTDLDSNKSFSDTTENNDSAYLSQNGSDQERSDVLDGLDSCLETKPKSSDVYNFNSMENIDRQANSNTFSCKTVKSSAFNKSASNVVVSQNSSTVQSRNKAHSIVASCLENKKIAKSKPRQKVIHRVDDCDLFKNLSDNLNGDLTQLLASNNWNIPALQQVLANYSGGDPGQLTAAIQQFQAQASGGVDFPASNLLSAAARAQIKQKGQAAACTLNGKNIVSQNSKMEVVTAPKPVVSSGTLKDVKVGIAPTAVCGTLVNSAVTQQQQPQTSFQQMGGGLIGNMMQFQQVPPASFSMNMLLPANDQGHMCATDSLHSRSFSANSDIKNGQGTINPLMTQGILATVSQTGDVSSQIQLSVASVIPPSLGSNVAKCSADSSAVFLNSFSPGMIMNAPMPPVSLSVVTNVTKSLAHVVPAIGINQTVFGAQQLLNSHQNGAQIITAAAPGTRMISTSPQGAQLINTATHGTQFVNPAAQRTHLISTTPQAAHIMNALSVNGLSNPLLITNPIQQVSPSNSLSQLSPAMTAHILAQSHPHLSQMSPSFLQNHIQNQTQNAVLNNQNIFTSVSLPALTIMPASTDVIASSLAQSGIISNNIQKNPRICDAIDNISIANGISQVQDPNASISNSSVYAATSQPVFVIPQPNPNPMMHMLGSAQSLNSSSGISTDLNITQGNLSQMFGQSAAVDQSLIQNLLTAGFSPLAIQQMMNTVSFNNVQQQQQQLQMLQLQQLMLQQLQGIPINQSSTPSQTTAIGTPTLVSAVIPQTSLQLNSLMDMNTLHPSLSPVAQGYQNQMSAAATPLQHISSGLTVHQVTHVNSCGAVSVVQSGGMPNLMQISSKCFQAGHSLQTQQLPSDQVNIANQTPSVTPAGSSSRDPVTATQIKLLISNIPKSEVNANSIVRTSCPSQSSSKSDFNKCENINTFNIEKKKMEDIAATVQQILAEAVQQQKELSLAAMNQPTPLPKYKK